MHILGMPHLGFSPVKWSQKVPGINAGFVGPEVYIIWRSFLRKRKKSLFCKFHRNKCTCEHVVRPLPS